MPLKYAVKLDDEQRTLLKRLLSAGQAPARKLNHARILLAADQHGPAQNNGAITRQLGVGRNTVFWVRQRFVQGGLDHSLNHLHPQHLKPYALSPEAEAHLIVLACTREPGRSRMSLRLLADKMVELGHVGALSHETVRQTLKKTRSSPTSKSSG